jgi:hypothetical protein
MEDLTPPPELVRAWNEEAVGAHFEPYGYSEFIAIRAAQYGADQELEACCAGIHSVHGSTVANWLRAMRRPKPPSLKERALEDLASIEANCGHLTRPETLLQSRRVATIRRALEALPND